MAKEDALWYVIHTYSTYEYIVKDSLEKQIENNNLQDSIFDIQIPTDEVLEENAKGKKKVVERKRIPSYVFLKMIYSDEIYQRVVRTNGVTGFVGPGGRPIPLTKDEVQKLGLDKGKVDSIDFIIGDEVQIMSGALQSYIGKVDEIKFEEKKVVVSVEMLGKLTTVSVDFSEVKKIDNHIVENNEN